MYIPITTVPRGPRWLAQIVEKRAVPGMTTFLFANVFVSGINIVGAGGMGRRTRHAALRDGLGMDENRPHVRPMKSGEPAKSNFKID